MGTILDKIFEDLSFQDSAAREVKVQKYTTVHPEDFEPVSMIRPTFEKGPWIAGGACLRWFQNLPVGESDIDVFCSNARQAADVIESIKSYGSFQIKWESENAVTLTHHRKDDWTTSWTIQVITRRYFNSLRDVINSFDITVCEVGTGGNEWELGSFTARDIRERNLRFKTPMQPDAPKRLVKYWSYGYRPVDGTLDNIIGSSNMRWSFDQQEDYNNAF